MFDIAFGVCVGVTLGLLCIFTSKLFGNTHKQDLSDDYL